MCRVPGSVGDHHSFDTGIDDDLRRCIIWEYLDVESLRELIDDPPLRTAVDDTYPQSLPVVETRDAFGTDLSDEVLAHGGIHRPEVLHDLLDLARIVDYRTLECSLLTYLHNQFPGIDTGDRRYPVILEICIERIPSVQYRRMFAVFRYDDTTYMDVIGLFELLPHTVVPYQRICEY